MCCLRLGMRRIRAGSMCRHCNGGEFILIGSKDKIKSEDDDKIVGFCKILES